MQFNKVLVLVTGESSDTNAVSHAASLVRESRGRLIVLYVIRVDRSLPLDAEMPEQVRVAEEVLVRAERAAEVQRNLLEAEMLQAREIGPAVVHEAAVRDIDAIVISTAYPTMRGEFSLGTDIPYVLQFSACNVILIREAIAGARPEGRQLVSRSGASSA
jgi:nucleotide-binding universal stress UspA family protein